MKKKDFDDLIESIREVGRIRRGEAKPSREFFYSAEAVAAIRARGDKSQSEFAKMIGVSVATLQNWEQGRRVPNGPALALLRVVAANPRVVESALAPRPKRGVA
jgi:putative transcriptional regulator